MKNLFFLLALAGCAGPPQTVFKPVAVDMPVAVPCHIAPVPPPDFATAHSAASDDLFSKTRAALVELDQRKAYEAELQSQLSICP